MNEIGYISFQRGVDFLRSFRMVPEANRMNIPKQILSKTEVWLFAKKLKVSKMTSATDTDTTSIWECYIYITIIRIGVPDIYT